MEEQLNNLHINFQERIQSISDIELINEKLIELFRNDLQTIKDSANGVSAGVLHKINTVEHKYKYVARIDDFEPKMRFLTNQTIVLMVGSFEVIIGDILKIIANESPDLITWPDKNKKIYIEPSDFTSRLTLGDIFINHLKIQGKSFQDLKSIHGIFNDYLGVDPSKNIPQEIIESMILMISYRHIIVHNNSTVDKQFLHQIRNTKKSGLYKEEDELNISDEEMTNLENSLLNYVNILMEEILKI